MDGVDGRQGGGRAGTTHLRGAGLGHGAQVLNQVLLGHANAAVPKGQGARILVEADVDVQVLVLLEQGLVWGAGARGSACSSPRLGAQTRACARLTQTWSETGDWNARAAVGRPPHPTRTRQGQEADLVQCVAGVGHHLAQEHVLLLVQGVDDDVHQTRHLLVHHTHIHTPAWAIAATAHVSRRQRMHDAPHAPRVFVLTPHAAYTATHAYHP